MKFTQRQVQDPRAQANFEQLESLWASVLALPPGGNSSPRVAYGSKALTWTAAVDSAVASVTHGLGRVPTIVVATIVATGADREFAQVGASTSTAFDLIGSATSGAFTGTRTAYWLAIG